MIYRLRAPFMSRIGQFEEGKHTLVCGVLESVILTGKGNFVMTLGNSETEYTLPMEKLKGVRHTIWVNPQGKRVWIIPVSEFNHEEIGTLKVEEPKEEVKKVTQPKLL